MSLLSAMLTHGLTGRDPRAQVEGTAEGTATMTLARTASRRAWPIRDVCMQQGHDLHPARPDKGAHLLPFFKADTRLLASRSPGLWPFLCDRYFVSTAEDDPARSLVQRVRDDPASAPHIPECLSCNLTDCAYATASLSKSNSYIALTCSGPAVPYTVILDAKTGRVSVFIAASEGSLTKVDPHSRPPGEKRIGRVKRSEIRLCWWAEIGPRQSFRQLVD